MELKPRYRATDVGLIPEDWDIRPLGDLGRFTNGINKGSDAFGYGSPFVNLLDVFGVPRISDSDTPRLGLVNTTPDERARYDLRRGDVLFVRSSVKPAGVGLSTLVANDLPDTVFCGFLIRYRDSGELSHSYKEHCFHEGGFRRRLLGNSTVSANTNINQVALQSLSLSFPKDAKEQEAIATALSDVDALIALLDRLIAKKQDLKQAAMQQLLTGQTRLPGFEGKWEVDSLRELCTKIQDGTHFSPRLGGQEFLYVTSKNIGFGKFDASTADRISAGEHAKIYARCDVRKGDVLLTKDGANTGNAALNPLDEPFSLLSSVALLRFDSRRHSPVFFLYQLLSAHGQRQIEALISGNAITRLTLAKIRLLQFPVTSFEEQTAIATVLADMDAELTALEHRRDKIKLLKQGMMQELLTGRTRLV